MLDRQLLAMLDHAKNEGNWTRAAELCVDLANGAVGQSAIGFVELLARAVEAESAEAVEQLISVETNVRYEYTIPGYIEAAQREGRQDIVENLQEEQRILAEIHQRTGEAYRRLQGVPIDDEGVANELLPLLAELLSMDRPAAIRSVIYELFLRAPQSHEFFDVLIELLPLEADRGMETDLLMQAVARSCDDTNVDRAWQAIRTKERAGDWFRAVARLANRKAAPVGIAADLRRMLDEDDLPFYAIEDLSTVKDRRVKDWFRTRLNSPDENIARVARRVAGKVVKPPDDVVYPAAELWPSEEVASVEVDIAEVPGTLRDFRAQWGLKLPRWLLGKKAFEFMDRDQAATIDVTSKDNGSLTLWLRMEDYDTIEIRLFRTSSANGRTANPS